MFMAAVGLVLAAPAQAAESIVGTWKMNMAKSTFSPGPAPKSITIKVEAAGAGIKITADGVGPDGKPTHASYTVNFDGKDVAATALPNSAETIAYKKIDDNTYESISKAKGKVVATTRIVVSPDGKTRTGTAVGTTVDGKPLKNVTVLERQ
jgi:histidinol dehydrogenase